MLLLRQVDNSIYFHGSWLTTFSSFSHYILTSSFLFFKGSSFSFFLTSARACQCTRNYKREKRRVSAHSVSARIALPKWRFFPTTHPPTTPPPSHFPVHERKLLILRKGLPMRTFFLFYVWSGIVHHFLGPVEPNGLDGFIPFTSPTVQIIPTLKTNNDNK